MRNKEFMDKIKEEYNGRLRELRRIINSYNLIVNTSSDNFDSLSNKILSCLYKDTNFDKVKSILDSELCITYGLFITEFNSDEIAQEIIKWWEDYTNL